MKEQGDLQVAKKSVSKLKRVFLTLDSFLINIQIIGEKPIFPTKMPAELFMLMANLFVKVI